MKGKILIIAALILFIFCCGVALNHIENYKETYYTKIDNTKVEKISTKDTMKYEYTLDSYNKNGYKKELKFKTRRKLKDAAYLALDVRTLGVYKWKEVEYNELTAKVKEKLR